MRLHSNPIIYIVQRDYSNNFTDYEIRLRPLCQKLRVVEKLVGGAHLLITGSPTVAVRVYDMDNINRLEGDDENTTNSINNEESSNTDDGVDGLRTFRDKFEHSLVIFVLPSGQNQRDQLGRRDSFVSLAQKSLLFRDAADQNNTKKHVTRTAIVTDVSQVISTIESVVSSLLPEKREKRRKYFEQQAAQHFLPGGSMKPSQEIIANQVQKTFNAWADRFEMAEGDASVVLNTLESLVNVGTASANEMNDVPIRDASKELIQQFFGSGVDNCNGAGSNVQADAVTDEVGHQNNTMEPQSYEDEFDFDDDIDELLAAPDPKTTYKQRSQETSLPTETPFHPRTLFQPATNQHRMGVQMAESVDFTPMVPPPRQLHQQQSSYNAAPSIFPDAYSTQGSLARHPSTGYPRQSRTFNNSHIYHNQTQMYAHDMDDSMNQMGNYQGPNGYDNMQGHNNQGRGGGYRQSYSQTAMYHPHQQFM